MIRGLILSFFVPIALAACAPRATAPVVLDPPSPVSSLTPAPGTCLAIDGDTIECGALRVRLVNVDTPELRGACAAETALARRAQGFTAAALRAARAIEIRPDPRRPRDRYGRTLAWVILDGRDLGDSLVAAHVARIWDGRRRSWCG